MIFKPLLKLGSKSSRQWCLFFPIRSTNPRCSLLSVFSDEKFTQHVRCMQYTSACNMASHQPSCPVSKGSAAVGFGSTGKGSSGLVRPEYGGKCRMGFIPTEWFEFFHVKTGVSGGYLFLLTVVNYCVSKEIFVMEHEYYTGLSLALMGYVLITKFGPTIGATLDKDVDAVLEGYQKGRKLERANYLAMAAEAKLAQERARGQKLLMDAKKENVKMQLEAAYRERFMHVYRIVKGRLDYHLKVHLAESRVHQKWMVEWILKNVMKSITPDFEQQALNQAIQEIEAVANRA